MTEFDKTEVEVRKDGSWNMVREFRIRINNEHGRETEGVQVIPFNARAGDVQLLEAFTETEGRRTKVVPANIETKEIDDVRAFDAVKKVTVSFPNVKPGSRIQLKYKATVREVAFPGAWSTANSIYRDHIESYSFKVTSELPTGPLHVWVHDPTGFLKVEQKSENGRSLVEIQSTRPLQLAVIGEEFPFLRAERGVVFGISSLEKWEDFAPMLRPLLDQMASQPLPLELKRIRDLAAKEPGTQKKLARVAALIAEEFRYFGDWRRRNGGVVPRSLFEIAQSRYGDCKDLTLATVAVLRALGLKADTAWVLRGSVPPLREAYTLPIDQYFNHAIARVEADGKTFWLDPTNPVSDVRAPFPDLAGRPALVLTRERAYLDSIPELDRTSARFESKLVYTLGSDHHFEVKGAVKLEGRSAIAFTMKSLAASKESIDTELVRLLAMRGQVLRSKVGDYARGSRVVEDLSIPIEFSLADIGLKTSAGIGFPLLASEVSSRLLVDERDRFSDLFVDYPGVSVQKVEIAGVRRVGRENLDCRLEARWVSFERTVKDTAQGVALEDRVEVKESVVANQELKSEKFRKLQARLRECFSRAAVILRPRAQKS